MSAQLLPSPTARAAVIHPRPYQKEAIAASEEAMARGVNRQLLALPTGTGKTVVFSQVIARRPGRALVIAHRDELICQAVSKVEAVAPDLRVGVVKADEDDFDAEVVIASVQTLSRPKRRERLGRFDTIIVD